MIISDLNYLEAVEGADVVGGTISSYIRQRTHFDVE
jgi:hypothetical protein